MASLITWNVRGLKSQNNVNYRKKVDKIITKLSNVQSTFILNLQETHLELENEVPKDWGNFTHAYHILFSGAIQNDKGAGIVCFINKTEDLVTWENVVPGRIIYAQVKNKANQKLSHIFSFYGKTNGGKEEKVALLDKLGEYMQRCNKEETIYVLGDFNYVTSTLDRNTSKYTMNDNIYKDKWVTLEMENELVDCFRKSYKTRRLYTYTSGTHAKSRIDRIYIANKDSGRVEKTIFENSDISDHKLVIVRLAKEIKRGPGHYVFNNTLLQDENFIQEIRQLIEDFKKEKYNFPNIKMMWDFLKMGIAAHANSFSIKKKQRRSV